MLQNPVRLGREQLIEKTTEVPGKYPNLKQKLAEKDICVSENQPLFGKCRLRAARFQKHAIRALIEKYESGHKNTSQKALFSQ